MRELIGGFALATVGVGRIGDRAANRRDQPYLDIEQEQQLIEPLWRDHIAEHLDQLALRPRRPPNVFALRGQQSLQQAPYRRQLLANLRMTPRTNQPLL